MYQLLGFCLIGAVGNVFEMPPCDCCHRSKVDYLGCEMCDECVPKVVKLNNLPSKRNLHIPARLGKTFSLEVALRAEARQTLGASGP